jgi:hypothetical protein
MRPSILIAAVLSVCLFASIVTAQVFLHPITINDIQSNGSSTSYFAKHPNKWNFAGSGGNAAISATGGTMTIGQHWAPYDPDLGAITVGSTTAKPTCTSALRGTTYDFFDNGDGGKDLTYVCCLGTAGTYSWIAGYCH